MVCMFLVVQTVKNGSLMLLSTVGSGVVKEREIMKVSLVLDMQNAQTGKGKAVSNFIRKFWTVFEQGIRKNTQM